MGHAVTPLPGWREMAYPTSPTRAPDAEADFSDRPYEVIVHEGEVPERVETALSEAEQAFLELQQSPRQFAAWARETRVAWSKRTGKPLRMGEA